MDLRWGSGTGIFLSLPKCWECGQPGREEPTSPGGPRSSGWKRGSFSNQRNSRSGKTPRPQSRGEGWCGPFWKFFLFRLFPHHFLKGKINTNIPFRVKVTGVYTISVKSYALKPS